MREFLQNVNKIYLANFVFISLILLSILGMFFVQFKVESLQDEISKTENEIASYQDKIQLLEIEWVYLTRPQRLRELASHYLKDTGYALASQIVTSEKLEKFQATNYKNTSNDATKESSEQISF